MKTTYSQYDELLYASLMSCSNPPVQTIQTVPMTVFSKGTATPNESLIFVLSPPSVVEIAPLLAGLRATISVANSTAAFVSQVVFQTTSDGITWETAIALETAASDDRVFTTDWYTTTSNFKRGIRVGVIASQESGVNSAQFGNVSLVIDFLLRS